MLRTSDKLETKNAALLLQKDKIQTNSEIGTCFAVTEQYGTLINLGIQNALLSQIDKKL